MEDSLLRVLSSPSQLKEECEQFLTKETVFQEERGVGLVNFLKTIVRAAFANSVATSNVAREVLGRQRELRGGVTALKSDMQEMLDHQVSEASRDYRRILKIVSEASNMQERREESLRQENAALRFTIEGKELQIKQLHEAMNQLKIEAAQGSTALSNLRLEKLQLLERAEAFERLLEERSQNLVDTTFRFEQQGIKDQLDISRLENDLRDGKQRSAFLRGKLRSGAEELESVGRRLRRLEATLQGLVVVLKWQADATQQKSCRARELENNIDQLSLALHQKLEDEAEKNQKVLVLQQEQQQELQNQKCRLTNLEESMQLVEESHRTTRANLNLKQAQLLLNLTKLEEAEKLIKSKDIESNKVHSELRETQEKLDLVTLQSERKISECENHAEVCNNLRRGKNPKGADEIAWTSKPKEVELDTSLSKLFESANGDETASRSSQWGTEAMNEDNTLAVCIADLSSTCKAESSKPTVESYADSPIKKVNTVPKGLSAWIDEDCDVLTVTPADDEDSQSDVWLEFDAARNASKRGFTAEKHFWTGASGPPYKKLRSCN